MNALDRSALTQRLEGSRFVGWQLYRLAAGGSRERLEVSQFYELLYPLHGIDAMGKTLVRSFPGAACQPRKLSGLLADRATIF